VQTSIFEKYIETAKRTDPIKCVGRISKVHGLLIESRGPQAIIGEMCKIISPKAGGFIRAEVVGLKNEIVQLMAFEETQGIDVGDRVIALGSTLEVPVSQKLLGRVLDAFGNPIDEKGPIEAECMYPALANPPDPLKRRRITERITTGVRAIDGLLAVGKGQRLGIFSGSGVGKSTLLGMIARYTTADVNVIALVGERGREVNDFIKDSLGEEGLKRSVLVVTPGNSPALSRLRSAYVATAIAEYFRDQGLDVMLMFDSVTRYARAMKEIGLASGEPAAQKAFPPSVFDAMPKLLERSGTSDKGSITGFYTVLIDADDMNDPVADTVRGILDGHIILSRRLADGYHYPAIDVLQSISRLAPAVSGKASNKAVGVIRRSMAVYAENEILINVGAYRQGSNPEIDEAVAKNAPIREFLMQEVDEPSPLYETLTRLSQISGVEIPDEEMIDTNEKLQAASTGAEERAARNKNSKKEKTGSPAADDASMALNSVASLFSSSPGIGSLGLQ
jgi:flagellum-specific ATP synthase